MGQFKGLANDFTNDAERALLSPDSAEYMLRCVLLFSCGRKRVLTIKHDRVGASKYRLAEWPIYAMLLWSLKAAMAVFYMRLTVSRPRAVFCSLSLCSYLVGDC